MSGNKVFILVIWSISVIFLISLLVSDDQSYCEASTVGALFPRWLRRIYVVTIAWSEYASSKEEYVSQFIALFIHFFMNL